MAGHDVLSIATQEVAEGRVGVVTLTENYDAADNGPLGEDAHIRWLLAELRAGRMTLAKLDAWERRWVQLDALADRHVLKGGVETAAVLGDALGHLERTQRPVLALVA